MTGIRPTLSINDIKSLAHCRRDRIEQAIATGVLRPFAVRTDRKGRTPGVLVASDEAMRWIASGAPTAPVSP